ncbi:hypothetical protein LJR129_005072 [Acidovorax sp. LjRoot129]|uniref:hypothetical protein n=1 Tax=unclassified Acidovorax TaxID=2684926 RepID=UPI003ED0482C
MQTQNSAIAAINFALETDDGLTFLRCWNEGNFEAIRREWPEAPKSVFVGADPLISKTAAKRRGLFDRTDVEKAALAVEQAQAVSESVQRKLQGDSIVVSESDLKRCQKQVANAKASLARLSSDHPLLKSKAKRR